MSRLLELMSRAAASVGVKTFKRLYRDYVAVQKEDVIYADSFTGFTGQPIQLDCGQWLADDRGITCFTSSGSEAIALNHPLLPVMRLVNIDTGEEKLKLAYRRGTRGKWREIIVSKADLAGKSTIVSLAKAGIAVNSENAGWLIRYLCDIESLNYDALPEMKSVSRLGWIGEDRFSPYEENLVYDGERSFGRLFDSVRQTGSFEEWKAHALRARAHSLPARIILAASLGSVLTAKTDALSFFVHLWGARSGIGKTVGLMFAASVWASPAAGDYVRTFRGTEVSMELSAAFVNNLPLILDEFQMVRQKKDFENVVYMLAEGIGKSRGAKSGGIRDAGSWRNCILTSGESPITNYMSGAGAFNRIVEIECTSPLFEDPIGTLNVIKKHYGHAGRLFVEKLQQPGAAERVREIYLEHYNAIVATDATEKQAMAGAVILTADKLAEEWLFDGGEPLTVEQLLPYLHTRDEIDVGDRAYDYICETVAANAARFNPSLEMGEHWGKFSPEGDTVYIINKTFEQICEEGGFSSRSVLSRLSEKGLVSGRPNGKGKTTVTRNIRFGSTTVRCVALRMPAPSEDEQACFDEII